MNEADNTQKGLRLLGIGGVIYLIILILLFVLRGVYIETITYLSLLLILFLPGLRILYREYSLKNRGFLLLIVGVISYLLSFLRMIFVDNGMITLYAGHNFIFLTLIFIIPAIFHIYLESSKEDKIRIKKSFLALKYYMSIVGITLIISLLFFGFGYPGQDYINRRFWISLGIAFLIAIMITGTIFIRALLFRKESLGETLPATISTILMLAVIIISLMLIFSQIFPINLVPEP